MLTLKKKVTSADKVGKWERLCDFLILSRFQSAVVSPTGVRGIRTIRAANLVDAQCERGAAERHVLRWRAERGGPKVHTGRVRYLF